MPAMPPMESATFGERLLLARRRQRLSQRELATRAGVYPTDVHRLENGLVQDPHASRVVALAQALNISIDWLLLGKTPCTNGQEERGA